ncbi:cholinephosphotransferase 1-like [Glandiceps talaboti]
MATEILSVVEIKQLYDHKYSSQGTSILEPFMQVIWEWLFKKVSASIAPNSITLTGLLINIATSLVIYKYCPTATEEAPCWVYLICAIGLFAYQTLDALDGKQARKYNHDTPLEELFDHGFDSISTVFVSVATGCAMQLGVYPGWFIYMCCVGIVLFYCAQWQAYVSGTVQFGKFDVTEAQLIIITIFMLSAVTGPWFWSLSIPILGLELKKMMVVFSTMAAIIAGISYFSVIFRGGIEKNGSTVGGPTVFTPGLQIGAILLLEIMVMLNSPSNVYENHPCLYILTLGIMVAKLTNKLVVAHMTKSEMSYLDTAMIGPGLLLFNQYFDTPISEYYLLWITLVISTLDLMRYFILVCKQISDELEISCFDMAKTKNGKYK